MERDYEEDEVSVRIGVLGPLEVRDAARNIVPVSGARLRSLLIRLAIDDGRPVSVDWLASDLWADGGPADAANAIQALVSRLRSAAGRDAVEYGPAGYRLAVNPGEVDARAFEQLVTTARGVLATGDRAGRPAGGRPASGRAAPAGTSWQRGASRHGRAGSGPG